ncbi:FAD dependent oxidoreductase [Purpureocillium lavendulum]|uniref:FAD dependent oxidoreductase n=1 Tax=Purpureocillium lavendulum TaxID=1247861 RepID=A0AB34FTK0_9HYPO|nr:FAD dependent oxidoreductase [Purpureocillium lavendulum]
MVPETRDFVHLRREDRTVTMGAAWSLVGDGFGAVADVVKAVAALVNKYNTLLARVAADPGLPVPSPTAPYWLADPPHPALADMQSETLPREADVVIIGSGITAAAAAKSILEVSGSSSTSAAPPVRVVVLEARQLCSGATGRNGGHIKTAPYEEFARLRGKLGPERACDVARFQMRHLPALLEVGKDHPLAEVREVETVDMFLRDEDFDKAKRDVDAMREWMPEVDIRVLEGQEARSHIGVNDMVVGALSYKAGALWPFRLVTGVWNTLLASYPHLSVDTHTPVQAVSKSASDPSRPYEVHTARGVVTAGHVLYATNGFTPHLVPSLRGRLTGVLGHMTAQRPGSSFPRCHGNRSWSIISSPGFDYITQRPDMPTGEPGDVMAGGGLFNSREQGLDQLGVWDDSRVDAFPVMHVRGSMATVFEPRWGSGSSVEKTWTGVMGFTGDMMPLVGRLPGQKPPPAKDSGEWIAAGFNGEGMVWAWLCGTAVGIMILGKEDEDLQPGSGRPGGKLDAWFPREVVRVDAARMRRAELKNLAKEAGV